MLFIHPMWDHEAQRIGKQRCTPAGYALHVAGDILGLVGLLLLFGTLASFAYIGLARKFTASLLWLLALPFGLGLVGRALYEYSWTLAARKGFHYDDERLEASWMEAGQRRSYRWEA